MDVQKGCERREEHVDYKGEYCARCAHSAHAACIGVVPPTYSNLPPSVDRNCQNMPERSPGTLFFSVGTLSIGIFVTTAQLGTKLDVLVNVLG